ncbi:Transposase and inactivated derivatives [Arthrobacter crystallopoietes]|jgi:transposase|uniref:Transposase and inactivated derivatives n=1 Tax=Crystallibacter crystallopoietes TaxID=37928 RepID=A0A1H1DVY6_9MICC|nr:transposase [Arthrobacter crystallopoietes]AUI50640.1 transposase [Arthrobacter crystallopoietes]AUI53509.1 transposase [Arthrobacter crystallopoietes]AUI53529.1 transposase [Arthrobacter crystallopoietes]SDQ66591.1 Transposase and inactivated derivatives [Arthrobacter crystallopoietes]
MYASSSLSEARRAEAVALFDAGYGYKAVASQLQASHRAIKNLYHRWRIRGSGALVTKPTKRTFSFEFKRDIVRRVLAGESKLGLAQEFDLSSPRLIENWLIIYRTEGEDGLRPKPKGRPRGTPASPERQESELTKLRRENERLRAENAYLGKLRALREQGRR